MTFSIMFSCLFICIRRTPTAININSSNRVWADRLNSIDFLSFFFKNIHSDSLQASSHAHVQYIYIITHFHRKVNSIPKKNTHKHHIDECEYFCIDQLFSSRYFLILDAFAIILTPSLSGITKVGA